MLIIGFWIIPLIFTIVAFAVSYHFIRMESGRGGFCDDLPALFYNSVAIMFTLIVWLVYFIIF